MKQRPGILGLIQFRERVSGRGVGILTNLLQTNMGARENERYPLHLCIFLVFVVQARAL